MNTSDAMQDNPIPAERLAEAGVWVARLQGDDRDDALERSLRRWLKAHPLNGRAFELATEVWEDSQNLRRVVPFAHEIASPRGSRSRRPLVALMATMVAFILIGAVLYFVRAEGITTGVGEQRLLVLEDGTRVFLNTQTRVVSRYDEHARRVELTSGEAWFEVAKKPDWPFIVTVGDKQVTALGTSFLVRYDARRTTVTLVEGKVAVSAMENAQSQPSVRQPQAALAGAAMMEPGVVTLAAGQRLTVAASGTAQIDTPAMDKATAWRRGQVILDDTILGDAVIEMNRYGVVKLRVQQAQTAEVVVNGLFQAGDSASFARAVAQTYGLRAIERDGEIVLEGTPRTFAQPMSSPP
jgi:transmembrane sensor